MIERVLEMTGSTVWSRGEMYKVVAHLMLLYGIKIWVVNGDILKVLTAFNHQAARQITGITAKREEGKEWEYPDVDAAMEAAGLHLIRVSIKSRQTTIAERVECRPSDLS